MTAILGFSLLWINDLSSFTLFNCTMEWTFHQLSLKWRNRTLTKNFLSVEVIDVSFFGFFTIYKYIYINTLFIVRVMNLSKDETNRAKLRSFGAFVLYTFDSKLLWWVTFIVVILWIKIFVSRESSQQQKNKNTQLLSISIWNSSILQNITMLLNVECGSNSSINEFISTTTTPTKSISAIRTSRCNAIFTLSTAISNATR